MPKRTHQPKVRHRKRVHGWRARVKAKVSNVVKSRRLKGRKVLSK